MLTRTRHWVITSTFYFLKIHFNIILPPCLVSFSRLLLTFALRPFMVCCSLLRATCPVHLIAIDVAILLTLAVSATVTD
jgi:hypothetical protein